MHDLVDPGDGRIDTLPHWRRSIDDAGLEDRWSGVVGDSAAVASRWRYRSPSASSTAVTARSQPGPTTGDGLRTWRTGAGSPSTTSSPTRPTGVARPTTSGGPLDSGEFVEDGECGSLRVLRRREQGLEVRPAAPGW